MAVTQIKGQQVKDASIDIVDLSATGTPSSATYLRGDNTWSTPTAGAAEINPNLRVLSSNYTIPTNSSLYFVSSLDDAGFTFDDAGAIFETG